MSGSGKPSKSMMYTQQISHLPAETIEHLTELLEQMEPKKYALIVHDKDVNDKGEPAEKHVHVMLTFENARSVNSIAKQLGDKPQYLQKWGKDEENGYAYLIHATTKSISKYQYPPEDVKANFNYLEEMRKITEKVKKSIQTANCTILLNSLYKGEITKREMEKKLNGNQYGRMKRQIEDVWNKHLQFQAEQWREEMKKSGKQITAIWISGEAGTGKTSLAIDYAQKSKQPYFITGSSRDLFQNYAGEHTMIIDELRPDMLKYPDLLRILDPFGSQVMAPSRYSDKPLTCDLILITSPYDPAEFHWELFRKSLGNYIDGLEQLLRRISLTIKMDASHIRAVEYDREKKLYLPVENAERENQYSKHYREKDCKEKDCAASGTKELFESMFDSAKPGSPSPAGKKGRHGKK